MIKNQPIMQLKDVSIVFEKRTGLFSKPTKIKAVNDVSLNINSGEIVALVGESGCGKTTLGKAIAGLLDPAEGQVFFNGIDVKKMNKKQFEEYRNGVQIVQQDSYAALNPARTIYQSLGEPLLHKKIVKDKKEAYERVCELLTTVELTPPEQFINKYPHQLSGGQRQRILMARAISLSPKLIVADEPVSMIDVSLRIAVLNLMARLNKTLGIAFVYITHDLATARYIAKNGKIVVMYLGELIEIGNVIEVIKDPKHPYLQALLSAVPIPNPWIAKQEKELPLKSLDMPSISNPPSGCRFNPRCIYATEKCEIEPPILRQFDNGLIACHNAEKIPKFVLPSIESVTVE